jgi:preprotein translocase subunit YajC
LPRFVVFFFIIYYTYIRTERETSREHQPQSHQPQ